MGRRRKYLRKSPRKHKKIWMFLILVGLMIVLNYKFQLTTHLTNVDTYQAFQLFVEQHMVAAVMIYVLLTIVTCVVLVLPGVTYAIVASLLFGPFWGTIYCVVAVTIGAGIAFIVGRYFLKEDIEPTIQKNKYLNKLLFQEANKNDFVILMITRLVPIFPYNLQNFAYGITDISFRSYMIYSFLFMIPGTAMYTIGTAGVMDPQNRVLYISITLVICVVVIALGRMIKKKYISEWDEAQGEQVNE